MSIVFPIGGYIYYITLKKLSTLRAMQMKKRIILSSILISIPLFLRGLYNLLKIKFKFDKEFANESLKNNDYRFPLFILVYYTSVDILPMLFQMLSVKWVIDHYNRKVNIGNGNTFAANYTETTSGKRSMRKDSSMLKCNYSETDDSFRDTMHLELMVDSTKDYNKDM